MKHHWVCDHRWEGLSYSTWDLILIRRFPSMAGASIGQDWCSWSLTELVVIRKLDSLISESSCLWMYSLFRFHQYWLVNNDAYEASLASLRESSLPGPSDAESLIRKNKTARKDSRVPCENWAQVPWYMKSSLSKRLHRYPYGQRSSFFTNDSEEWCMLMPEWVQERARMEVESRGVKS